ncbi:MAG TPA: helix-turn-helix transcriptional regulator [Thermoanaerobaculia bacterium]
MQASGGRRLGREIGSRIVRLRKERGWSQAELARRLNVHRSRVSHWERGIHMPALETLSDLSALFGITLDFLVSGQTGLQQQMTRSQRQTAARHLTELARALGLSSRK